MAIFCCLYHFLPLFFISSLWLFTGQFIFLASALCGKCACSALFVFTASFHLAPFYVTLHLLFLFVLYNTHFCSCCRLAVRSFKRLSSFSRCLSFLPQKERVCRRPLPVLDPLGEEEAKGMPLSLPVFTFSSLSLFSASTLLSFEVIRQLVDHLGRHTVKVRYAMLLATFD